MRALNLAAMAAALAGILAAQPAVAASGEALYNDNCAACHQKMGQGVPGAFPPLKADKLALGDPKPLAFLMMHGRGGMPAFKDNLSDAELASVMNYVRAAWGNKARPLAASDFARVRTGPPPSTRLQAH